MLSAFVDESKEQEVKNYISGTTVFPIVYSDDAVRWKKSRFFSKRKYNGLTSSDERFFFHSFYLT